MVDQDGAPTIACQWQALVGGALTNIAAASTATLSITNDQSAVGKQVRVVVTTTDLFGGTTDFFSPAQTIANVEDEATGTLAVTGDVRVGGSVTATLNKAVDAVAEQLNSGEIVAPPEFAALAGEDKATAEAALRMQYARNCWARAGLPRHCRVPDGAALDGTAWDTRPTG